MKYKIYIIFILSLVIPFVIKVYSSTLEIYPSVVLPAGARKLELSEDKISMNTTIALIETVNGKKVNILESEILYDIPAHYVKTLINNEFGVKDTKFINNNEFLKERLRISGFNPNQILLKTIKVTYYIKTEKISEEVVLNKYLIL